MKSMGVNEIVKSFLAFLNKRLFKTWKFSAYTEE